MQPPLEDHALPVNPPPVHPLAAMISAAAAGRYPPADGGWRRVTPWRPGLEGIVAFTGHAVLAVAPDISDERLVELGAHGFGGAHDPRLVAALAGPDGWIDSLDVLLAGRGTAGRGATDRGPAGSGAAGHGTAGHQTAGHGPAGSGTGSAAGHPGEGATGDAVIARLVDRPDLAAYPRARFAAEIRDRPRFLGYPDRRRSALAIISSGLAGLTELSFELEPEHRGTGGGTTLIRDALSTIPADELIVAAVAPGNAASLRALLRAGFVPLGSMQLFRRARR